MVALLVVMMVVMMGASTAGLLVVQKVDWRELSMVVHSVVHSAVHSESW